MLCVNILHNALCMLFLSLITKQHLKKNTKKKKVFPFALKEEDACFSKGAKDAGRYKNATYCIKTPQRCEQLDGISDPFTPVIIIAIIIEM